MVAHFRGVDVSALYNADAQGPQICGVQTDWITMETDVDNIKVIRAAFEQTYDYHGDWPRFDEDYEYYVVTKKQRGQQQEEISEAWNWFKWGWRAGAAHRH